MATLRSLNKQKRRERILAEARRVIASEGFDALNLRDLARSADISVPTIYNLIGCKEQLLQELMLGAFADFDRLMQRKPAVPLARLPVKMLETLVEMIATDEDYYRATFLASERVEDRREVLGDSGLRRAQLRRLAGSLFEEASARQQLRGQIDARILVEQVLAAHQMAYRDWAHRIISLEQFRTRSLCGFYVALAADAEDAFREELLVELNARLSATAGAG